jgi:hypothetical protein
MNVPELLHAREGKTLEFNYATWNSGRSGLGA